MTRSKAARPTWVYVGFALVSAVAGMLSGVGQMLSGLGPRSDGERPALPVRVEVPTDPRLLSLASRVDRLGDDYARSRTEVVAARKAEAAAERLAAQRGEQVTRLLDQMEALSRELKEARLTLAATRQESAQVRQRLEQLEGQLADARAAAERTPPPAPTPPPRSSLLPSLVRADDRPALLRQAVFAAAWERLEQLDRRYATGEIGTQRFLEEVVAESSRMLGQCDLLAPDCTPDQFISAKRMLRALHREAIALAP